MSTLETLHQEALKQYEINNIDKVLEIYQQILAMNPFDEVALGCIMDIYLERGDKLNYYLTRADLNVGQNKLEFAINDVKKALELDQENTNVRMRLAVTYKAVNKNLKAIDEFLKVLEYNHKEINAYFELIDLYMKENSIESAIDIANRGLEAFPDDENLSNALAQLYFRNNDPQNALKVVLDEFLKAKILLQDNRNDEAKEILDKYNTTNTPLNRKSDLHILKAQFAYNNAEYETALSEVEEYIKLNGPNPVSFQMKALIYEGLNDMFNAHLNWGFCKKTLGKSDEAIVEFENAYRINDKDKTVLIELYNLYMQNKERFVAIEYMQKVYDIDKDEQAKNILAEFYYSQGNFEKAEEFGKTNEKKQKSLQPEENYTGLIDKIMGFFSKNKD